MRLITAGDFNKRAGIAVFVIAAYGNGRPGGRFTG
jgi:hypothetical protein